MASASEFKLNVGLDLRNPLKKFKINEFNEPHVLIDKLLDYDQIASYNWFGKLGKEMIIIPGAPKRLVQWKGGQLEKDEEDQQTYYGRRKSIHEHHYMTSSFPMEALFQSVILCNEDDAGSSIKFQDFDIVADRNNLRKLWGILGLLEKHGYAYKDNIRIDVQRFGNLICLIRCEEMDVFQMANIPHPPVYGRDFQKRCCEPINVVLEGSFRQVVTYKLGLLKFMVRFEVDCADYTKSVPVEKKSNQEDVSTEKSVEDLLANLNLSEPTVTLSELKGEWLPGSDLYYFKKYQTYKYHFVELATRIFNRSFPIHIWPHMFFSGIKSLVIGWQNRGNVMVQPEPYGWESRRGQKLRKKGVEVFTVEDVLSQYGGFPEAGLIRFHNFLAKLVDFIRERDDQKTFSVYWSKEFPNEISIFEVNDLDVHVVPDGLKQIISNN